MPMLDAYIPAGALSPSAERELLAKIADLLLEHEGVDPGNERARPLAWVFVHRPQVYVAGAPPKSPRYRFICQVPEGQYDDERRAAVTAAMTQAVAEAEGGAWPHPELRVCVFTCEVPEGWRGGAGRILKLADIYEFAWPLKPGVDGTPRERAAQVLAARRRQEAKRLLADPRKELIMTPTEKANATVMLDIFSAIERRDPQRLADLCHPDVEFLWPAALPYGGTARGLGTERPTWIHTWAPLQPTEAERSMEPRVVASKGDEVVVLWRQRGLSPGGDRFDGPVLALYTVREGRLARAQMFYFDTPALVEFLARASGVAA